MSQGRDRRLDEKRLDELYWRAVELDQAGREGFLAGECRDDEALRARLEALLEEADETQGRDGGYLRSLAFEVGLQPGDPPDPDRSPSRVGLRYGPYETVELIGRGGMGAVYLADRVEGDFEQRVAIKVVRRGMESREVEQRLRRERSILARLEHPNIARLFDGGVGPEGLPYLVLEYVDGERITDHCERNSLSLGDRLRLFLDVARAVQFAHANLVVHRDLKPSNVLVTPSGEVKLLDFGISKLLETDEGDEVTRTGASVLTPAYAAPEQLLGQQVSTATDIFALGVLLYELLAGEHPFRPSEEAVESVSQRILEFEPRAPDTSGAVPTPRDLGLVCMRALRKEPERRYGSAADMARDVQRFLAGEPVTARPPTLRYRARKFVGRYRVAVIASAAALLALVSGMGVAVWQARTAAAEAARANRINEFVLDLFRASDPDEALGEELSARDLLDRGAQRLESSLEDEPEVRAEMLLVLGSIHRELGLFDAALPPLETALQLSREAHGEDSREATDVLLELARLADRRKSMAEADSLFSLVLRRYEAEGRRGARLAAQTAGELGASLLDQGRAEEAEALISRSLEYGRANNPSGDLAMIRLELAYANALHQLERWDEAGALYQSVADQVDQLPVGEQPLVTATLWRVAQQESVDGRPEEALALMRQTLAVRRRVLGDDHPSNLDSQRDLAALLGRLGRYDEAAATLDSLLATHVSVHGEVHDDVAMTAQALGVVLSRQGKYDQAAERLEQASDVFAEIYGGTHMFTSRTLQNLGRALTAARRFGEAADAYQRALEGYAPLGADHTFAVQTRVDLAASLVELGRGREADSLARHAIESYGRMGRQGVEFGLALVTRGRAERLIATADRAEATLREAADALRAIDNDVGLEGQLLASTADISLADLLIDEGRLDEAEPLLLAAHELIAAERPPSHAYHRVARATLEKLYLARGDAERAAEFAPIDGG